MLHEENGRVLLRGLHQVEGHEWQAGLIPRARELYGGLMSGNEHLDEPTQ